MRSLLRWTSLVGGAAVLYALGVRRLHLHDFPVFLVILLVLSVLIVVVFLLTRADDTA